MNEDDVYRFEIRGPITPQTFGVVREHLTAASARNQDVVIGINSGGGDIASAMAVYGALRAFRNGTRAEITLAASAASVIAMGCGERAISANGAFMLHPTRMSVAFCSAAEVRDAAERLQRIDDDAAFCIHEATGMDLAAARDLLANETWLTAGDALELRLATDIIDAAADPPQIPVEPEPVTAEDRAGHLDRLAVVATAEQIVAAGIATAEAMAVSHSLVSSTMRAEPVPFDRSDAEIGGLLEIRARRHSLIHTETARLRALPPESSYRPGGAVWTCRWCGAPNSHDIGADYTPTPCVTCRSTGITED